MALIKMCHITQAVQLASGQLVAPLAVSGGQEKKTLDVNKPATKAHSNGVVAPLPPTQREDTMQNTEEGIAPTIKTSEQLEESQDEALSTNYEQEEDEFETDDTFEDDPISDDEARIDLYEEEEEEEEEVVSFPKPNHGLSSLKLKSNSLLKLKSLDSLHAEVAEDEENVSDLKAKLTKEDLDEAWQAYIEGAEKDSVKTMLKGAEVSITGQTVTVVVGSALAESTIRQERSLMDYLRESLHAPMLAMKINLDPSRSNAAPAKPKKLTDSEKYWRMKTINPLVDEVRKRFDLKLENE